jgi:hypothetical protein
VRCGSWGAEKQIGLELTRAEQVAGVFAAGVEKPDAVAIVIGPGSVRRANLISYFREFGGLTHDDLEDLDVSIRGLESVCSAPLI